MDKKRDAFFLPDGKSKARVIKERKNDKFKKIDKKNNKDEPLEGKIKKTFDKKSYRLKKYSKKYKLEQWEEQRKKKLLRNYYKEVKNDTPSGSYKLKTFDDEETDNNVGRYVRHPDLLAQDEQKDAQDITLEKKKENKKDPFLKAKEQYNKIKQEKLDKQLEKEKAKEERKQKLQEYKKKKAERFKKLSRKTKKGQPVMTGRLELLLEKIQNNK